MRYEMPVLKRLAAKLVHDILPAALASIIGGFLFSQFHFGRAPELPAAASASAEMMQLLRDEHGLMVKFLNAELAKEKARLATTEDASLPAGAATEPSALSRPPVIVVAATKPAAAPRGKAPVVSVPLPPPLVIAQAQQSDDAKPAGRGDDSLFAKTVGLKDHVVAATQSVVSAIGGIPSWIGLIGDHIGGRDVAPRPQVDLISAS